MVLGIDASLPTGHGHVMRCLALVDSLRERKATCSFVCCDQPETY